MIDSNIIQRVRETADSHKLDIIQDYVSLTKHGKEYIGICPICGGKNFTYVVKDGGLYKCFNCGFGGKDVFTLMEKVNGSSFIDNVRTIANKYYIDLEEGPRAISGPKESKLSFCERMLKESGLTYKDVTATVNLGDGSTKPTARTFRPGTVNDKGEIISGDDAIIEYYDLDGKPVTYERKDSRRRGTGQFTEYFRVRWQYPDAHKGKDGNASKYRSPYGSGTPVYIPQALRNAYNKGVDVPRLYIQEGEKKAEKACKHGILSFGIAGIMNLGYNGSLPQDIVRFIQKCHVKEVVFLFDSDWNDLSSNLRISVSAEKRPYNFYNAAKNFKEYMNVLADYDIYVEIYVGHTVSHNGDKGIDDLLANTLKGRESELTEDIEHAMHQKVMDGKYVRIVKVTTMTDKQIQRLWGLDNVQSFAEMHLKELSMLPEFTFRNHRYRIEDGKAVLSQPFDDDEKFWEEVTKSDRNGNERVECSYSYVNARNFLQRHGFGRYRISETSYEFIHIENHFVSTIQHTDARDYLVEFAESNCSKLVLEMLFKGSVQYLGPDKLSILKYVEPNFLQPNRDSQYFYFREVFWCITRSGIEELRYNAMTHDVWADRHKDISVQQLPPLIHFDHNEDGYHYTISSEGKQCHFLQFLENASNFTWRKAENGQIDEGELKGECAAPAE